MKKLLTGLFLGLSVLLVACSSDESDSSSAEQQNKLQQIKEVRCDYNWLGGYIPTIQFP